MENQEIWKDVPGYEGKLQVSTLGRVRSLRILKAGPATGNGYPVVHLPGGKKGGHDRAYVHFLVAAAFIGPRPVGYQVNHLDAVHTHNRPENLEYVTVQGNQHYAFKIGNRKHHFTAEEMDQIAVWFFDDGKSQTEIAWLLTATPGDVAEMRRKRKKVRSVCEIWRAAHRNGRTNPYERHLTWTDVDRMRLLYKEKQANQEELGKMFGCHPSHVSRIVNGLIWPEADRPTPDAEHDPSVLEHYRVRQANHPRELQGLVQIEEAS
jgi:hypothetical protein